MSQMKQQLMKASHSMRFRIETVPAGKDTAGRFPGGIEVSARIAAVRYGVQKTTQTLTPHRNKEGTVTKRGVWGHPEYPLQL